MQEANDTRDVSFPALQITNVVASFSLGVHFSRSDMHNIVNLLPGSEYKEDEFKALITKGMFEGNKISMNLFRTGNVIVIGKTPTQLFNASVKLVKRLRSGLYMPKMQRFRICNCVQSGQMDFEVDLALLEMRHRKNAQKRESFPGLQYRLESLRLGALYNVSLTIFSTGKIIIRSKRFDKEFTEKILAYMVPILAYNRKKQGGGAR